MKALTRGELRMLAVWSIARIGRRVAKQAGVRRLANLLGDVEYTARRSSRESLARGLALTLGCERTAKPLNKLTREVFRNKLQAELFLWGVKSESVPPSILGLEHLQSVLERGKGAILWECDFGNRLLAKATIADCGFPLTQVHTSTHWGSTTWVGQNIVKKYRRQTEAELFPEIIEIADESLAYLRRMINLLNQNGIICLSALGERGEKFVVVEFLGRQRLFSTGALTLARNTTALIIPIFCFKDDNNADMVVLEKPISRHEDQSTEQATMSAVRDYVRLLESYIYRYPTNGPKDPRNHFQRKVPFSLLRQIE